MDKSLIRVLVVEDYEPIRRYISTTLQNQGYRVIGEVADGLEAVQQAQKLQPDLILLDIALPRLNGLEAARHIRAVSPSSKIIIVSENRDAVIAELALSLGAGGYVRKSDAARELLSAVKMVLEGKRYVSAGLAHDLNDRSRRRTSNHAQFTQRKNAGITRQHEADFYSDTESFLDGFTQFIAAALETERAVIVVVTESRRNSLLQRLQTRGLDLSAAIEEGRYLSLDVTDTLSTFMVNGLPDPARFFKAADDLIRRTANAVDGEQSRVAACGECAPLLWTQGNAEAAIRLERLWDEIAITHKVAILCGYSLSSFQGGLGSGTFEKICATHSATHSL